MILVIEYKIRYSGLKSILILCGGEFMTSDEFIKKFTETYASDYEYEWDEDLREITVFCNILDNLGYNIYFLLTMGILESKIKTIKLHKKSFKLTVSNEYW